MVDFEVLIQRPCVRACLSALVKSHIFARSRSTQPHCSLRFCVLPFRRFGGLLSVVRCHAVVDLLACHHDGGGDAAGWLAGWLAAAGAAMHPPPSRVLSLGERKHKVRVQQASVRSEQKT